MEQKSVTNPAITVDQENFAVKIKSVHAIKSTPPEVNVWPMTPASDTW